MNFNAAAFFTFTLLLGSLVTAYPRLDDPLLRAEDFDDSTDSFDDEDSFDETSDDKAAAVPSLQNNAAGATDTNNDNPDDLTKILEDLEATAKHIQEEDVAGVDPSTLSHPFVVEETLASLMKAVHASIAHTQAHASIPASVLKTVASEAKQIQKDIELRRTGKGDPGAEREIADEIHRLEDRMREETSVQARQNAEEDIAGVFTNVGAHIDETKGGAGNPVEEKEIAQEIGSINDALQTALTGRGSVAAETEVADEIKTAVQHAFGTRVKAAPVEENSPLDQHASPGKTSITEAEGSATAAPTEESAIGKLIHGVAGFITGGSAGEQDVKEPSPSTDDKELQEDEITSIDTNSFLHNDDEPSTSNPSSTSSNSDPGKASEDLASYDDDDDYKPGDSSASGKLDSSSDIAVQEDVSSAGGTWHLTAMTVTMCALIGVVLLVVVGIWHRRMSFRGGLPAASTGQLVLEDDEDAVYTATTQPVEPPLGRYSKLT